MVEGSEQPGAAWYPDPQKPGRLRWWDGTQWTQHTHPPEPPRRLLPWLIGGLVVVALIVGAVLLLGGDGGGDSGDSGTLIPIELTDEGSVPTTTESEAPTGAPLTTTTTESGPATEADPAAAADTAAQAQVRTAQTSIETFALDDGGLLRGSDHRGAHQDLAHARRRRPRGHGHQGRILGHGHLSRQRQYLHDHPRLLRFLEAHLHRGRQRRVPRERRVALSPGPGLRL